MRVIRYWYYFNRFRKLENLIGYKFLFNFNIKRLTLYYMITKDLDYSFYKVHDMIGVDALNRVEKKLF